MNLINRIARTPPLLIAAVMSSCLGYGVDMEILQTNVAVRMKKLAKPEGLPARRKNSPPEASAGHIIPLRLRWMLGMLTVDGA